MHHSTPKISTLGFSVAWIAYKSLYFYTFIILSFFFVLVLKKTWNQPPLYFLNLNLRSGQVRLSHDILSIVTMIVCMYESVLRNKFSGFQYTLWVKEVVLLPSILQVAKIKWWKLLLDSNTSISCYIKSDWYFNRHWRSNVSKTDLIKILTKLTTLGFVFVSGNW